MLFFFFFFPVSPTVSTADKMPDFRKEKEKSCWCTERESDAVSSTFYNISISNAFPHYIQLLETLAFIEIVLWRGLTELSTAMYFSKSNNIFTSCVWIIIFALCLIYRSKFCCHFRAGEVINFLPWPVEHFRCRFIRAFLQYSC